MIKYIFVVLFLLTVIIGAFKFPQQMRQHQINRYINILERDSMVYILSLEDARLYKNPDYIKLEKYTDYAEKAETVKAFYHLYKMLTESEAWWLMTHHEQPHMRVYGYYYYTAKIKNMDFRQIARSILRGDTISYYDEFHYTKQKCYASDAMLLFALNGVTIPFVYNPDFEYYIIGGLTAEQKNILYAAYKKRIPLNDDIDEYLEKYFKQDPSMWWLHNYIEEE